MILFQTAPSPAAQIDKAIAILEKQRIGSFSVSFKSLEGKVSKSGTYDVAYIRPDQLRLRTKVAGTDRTYWLMGNSLYAVDHKDREWLLTSSKKTGSALQRMSAIVAVDEPVRMMVDPVIGKNFLTTFKSIKDWQRAGKVWVGKDGRGKFSIGFDASGRFSSFRVDSPAGWLAWTYSYGKPGAKIPYPSTAGFKRVDAFYDESGSTSGLPAYADTVSKAAVAKSLKEYGRLTSVAFAMDDGSGKTEVWLQSPNVRQRDKNGDWAWIDGNLTFKKGGKFVCVNKKLSWRQVDDYVGKAGSPVNPILSKLQRKENPLIGLLGPDLKGRAVGALGFGGVMCDVVEFKGPGVRMTLTIRRDNSLLHAVQTENLDSKSNVLAQSERRYTYSSWGKTLTISPPK